MAASIAVARRSVLRRQLESFPKFYSSNRASGSVDSGERSLMAVQALGLATLNVMSFGILLTGGLAYAFDLCNLSELRARTRIALQRPGNFTPEDEQEMEKMMGSIMDKLGMQKPQELEEEEEVATKAAPGEEKEKEKEKPKKLLGTILDRLGMWPEKVAKDEHADEPTAEEARKK